MAVLINAFEEAIGSVKAWIRLDETVTLPQNWLILDGSVVVDVDSPWNGKTLPDLRGKFIKGHASLSNANFATDTTYKIDTGGSIPSGGVATHNLAHTHPIGAHVHPIGNHTHTITSDPGHQHSDPGHSHTIPSHSHSIAMGGSHNHGGATSFQSQTTGSAPGSQGIIGPGPGPNGHNHLISSDGNHNHGGNTGGSGVLSTSTNSGGDTGIAGAHNHGGTTGPASGNTDPAASGNTDSGGPIIDNEPPFLGLLMIVKVK